MCANDVRQALCRAGAAPLTKVGNSEVWLWRDGRYCLFHWEGEYPEKVRPQALYYAKYSYGKITRAKGTQKW